MTITIYDLMGLMKDGKAPKKIKIDNREYDYNLGDYYSTKGVSLLNDYNLRLCNIEEILEAKIEILPEENDEWEDIYTLSDIEEGHFMNRQNGMTKEDRRLLDSNFKTLGETINQLIKNQKYLKEKLDKYDRED